MHTNEWAAVMRGIKSIIGLSFYFHSSDDIIYIKYVHTIYHSLSWHRISQRGLLWPMKCSQSTFDHTCTMETLDCFRTQCHGAYKMVKGHIPFATGHFQICPQDHLSKQTCLILKCPSETQDSFLWFGEPKLRPENYLTEN